MHIIKGGGGSSIKKNLCIYISKNSPKVCEAFCFRGKKNFEKKADGPRLAVTLFVVLA